MVRTRTAARLRIGRIGRGCCATMSLMTAVTSNGEAADVDISQQKSVVMVREPSWLPLNKYEHEGKEVLRITGSMVFGQRCQVHYVDGSKSNEYKQYTDLDALIKRFEFIVYKGYDHDRYYQGEFFTAVPPEDPTEWEHIPPPAVMPLSNAPYSGWRPKHNQIAAWYNEPKNARLRETWGAYLEPDEFQTWQGFVAVTNAYLDREAG